jgi:transaldolase
MSKLIELEKMGQSIWLDYIQRSMITSGELKQLIDIGLRGVTSNPAIFEKAIAGSNDYDEDLKQLLKTDQSLAQIYEALAIKDISLAADQLRGVYDSSSGKDGYVSLEVSPELAYETEKTIAEAKRLFENQGAGHASGTPGHYRIDRLRGKCKCYTDLWAAKL